MGRNHYTKHGPIKLGPKRPLPGGQAGWCRAADTNVGALWLRVRRGRYVGKVFGNKAFKWHAEVARVDDPTKNIWRGEVGSGISAKQLALLALEELAEGGRL